jgi:hypothetical protein
LSGCQLQTRVLTERRSDWNDDNGRSTRVMVLRI